MLKKIVLGLVAIVILLGAFMAYFFFYGTRRASPEDTVSFKEGELEIQINYCRPSKKGRLIFGTEENGALIPYGKYWRTGANYATEFTVNKEVFFAGEPIAPGTYSLYTIPGRPNWEVRLNSDTNRWSFNEPDYNKDVISVNVPASNAPLTEQFTIKVEPAEDGKTTIFLIWEETSVAIPVSPSV